MIRLKTKYLKKKLKSWHLAPNTAWQIEGEKVEIVTDFLFLGSKITVDGDCSHEIRRQLLLGRKAMTNLDRVLKSRDITLPTKVNIVKAMVFPVVTYSCESWTVKKAECQKTDACELWCWRRLLRVSWTKKIKSANLKGNQHWIFVGRTDTEAETPVFWSFDVNSWLIGKVPDAGKDWGQKEKRDGWMASPKQRTWAWTKFGSWWGTGRPGVLQSMGLQRVGWTEQLNWTELNWSDLLAVKGLWDVLSSTTVQRHRFFGAPLPLRSCSHIHTWP